MRGKKRSLVLAVTAAFGLLLTACGTTPAQPQLAGNTGQVAGSSAPSSSSTSESSSSQPSSNSTTTPPKTTQPTTTPPKPKPKPEKKDTVEPASANNGTPCKDSARACIDLSANKAWIMDNGKVVAGPVPITHGRKGWLTPPGSFKVSVKRPMHYSSIFNNAKMPWSVFFNGGIAFHQGSLREKSHGCIHLSPTAAKQFYNHLNPGDIVHVVL